MKHMRLGRVERWHIDVGAERQLRKIDWHQYHQVVAVPLKSIVVFNTDEHMQVTTRAAAGRITFCLWRLALASKPDRLTSMNASRNAY